MYLVLVYFVMSFLTHCLLLWIVCLVRLLSIAISLDFLSVLLLFWLVIVLKLLVILSIRGSNMSMITIRVRYVDLRIGKRVQISYDTKQLSYDDIALCCYVHSLISIGQKPYGTMDDVATDAFKYVRVVSVYNVTDKQYMTLQRGAIYGNNCLNKAIRP